MDFEETEERRLLDMLIGLLLERAFASSAEFEHACVSAGEALGNCLEHFGAARNDGWSVHLTMPKDWIRNKVRRGPLQELPALGDALDIFLSFETQYGTVAGEYLIGEKPAFAADLSALLQQMGLLDKMGMPDDRFLLVMVNHHFVTPINGVWDASIDLLLTRLAKTTLDSAPKMYADVVQGQSEQPLTWAEGYLSKRWRYGAWMSDSQLARAVDTPHVALPRIVTRTIAEGGDSTNVPPGYRR